MPRATVRLSVHGERFKALSRDLREAGDGRLQRDFRREIRKAGKPVVADVQNAARKVRVSSTQGGHARPDSSTGLRKRVAAATTISVRKDGIRIKVASKKVGPYGRKLSKYLDASLGRYVRWRHPVFAKKGTERADWRWVQQKGSPFFAKTIRKHSRDFRAAVERAMDDVENKLS